MFIIAIRGDIGEILTEEQKSYVYPVLREYLGRHYNMTLDHICTRYNAEPIYETCMADIGGSMGVLNHWFFLDEYDVESQCAKFYQHRRENYVCEYYKKLKKFRRNLQNFLSTSNVSHELRRWLVTHHQTPRLHANTIRQYYCKNSTQIESPLNICSNRNLKK